MGSSPRIASVFVSSTWLDLQPERKAVETAVHRLRETRFVGMEHFGSRDESTHRASLDEVDRSTIYVGIIAGRYGQGITEAEYRRARERGLPCLMYLKDDATIAEEWRERDAGAVECLARFKADVRVHTLGPAFLSPDDLAARVTRISTAGCSTTGWRPPYSRPRMPATRTWSAT